MTPTPLQEADAHDLVYNTGYQFRVRPSLVSETSGETVEEGLAGPASAYYKTACIGKQ